MCEMAAARDRRGCQGAAGVGCGGRQCQAHTCAKGQVPCLALPSAQAAQNQAVIAQAHSWGAEGLVGPGQSEGPCGCCQPILTEKLLPRCSPAWCHPVPPDPDDHY